MKLQKQNLYNIEIVCSVTQSCLTLCNPMDYCPLGSFVHEFSRQEYCSGLPFPSPGNLLHPGTEPVFPIWQLDSLSLSHLESPEHLLCLLCSVVQLCPILCSPVDCSRLGSSVHGILQARILEWVARPSSEGSSRPRDRTQVSLIAGRFFTI